MTTNITIKGSRYYVGGVFVGEVYPSVLGSFAAVKASGESRLCSLRNDAVNWLLS